jgi:hypothetical protein
VETWQVLKKAGGRTVKKVNIPIVDGKYRVLFPEKCVYCGAPKEVEVNRTESAGSSRRKYYATVAVPYCTAHLQEEKRNARFLLVGFLSLLVVSCCVLFGVTTSIKRDPSVEVMLVLALVALGLAYAGRGLLRKVMSGAFPTMADMRGSNRLGMQVSPSSTAITFWFTNDQIAEEFAQLNGQSVSE